MFSHVTIGSNDVPRAKAFYEALLAPLGLVCKADYPPYAAGFGRPDFRPQFWVLAPLDKQPASVGNGGTVGLEAADRATVDAAYKAALAAGAQDEGAPGLRSHYHPSYYGAYVRDLDGHKICIVCHKSQP